MDEALNHFGGQYFLWTDLQPAEAAAQVKYAVLLEALEAVGVAAGQQDGTHSYLEANGALALTLVYQLQ